LQEQKQQREERIKQDQIMREENQHREELFAQERQRQAQLEARREAVRKQLEDGVEAMYQDALSLYKQGEYGTAADRFKDVQDILPGYKRSEQYLDEARAKSFDQKSQAVVVPDTSGDSTPSSPAPITDPAPSASSHQDNVSKALDLFDPNAK